MEPRDSGQFGTDQTQADIALLERVGARDERAVGELYDRHSRLLYSLIVRMLRDRGDAEDVLQEVFVALWTRVDTYNVELGSPVAWLVRIARNRAIDRLRAAGVRAKAVISADELPATASPEDYASAAEEGRVVLVALTALPPEQRALIEDAYFLGLTHAELAARHRLPLGTVKTRIRTGMQALRQALAPVKLER